MLGGWREARLDAAQRDEALVVLANQKQVQSFLFWGPLAILGRGGSGGLHRYIWGHQAQVDD